MKTAVAAVVALGLCATPSAFAQDAPAAEAPRLPAVIRASDTSLTCAAMADEAARLSETMGGDPGGGLFGRSDPGGLVNIITKQSQKGFKGSALFT